MGIHKNTGVCRSIHGYTYKYRGVQEFTGVYIQMQGCTEVYMGTHTNTGVYRSLQGYTYKYRGVQEYSRFALSRNQK